MSSVPASPPGITTFALTAEHEAQLQRFFEANPEYYLICNGEPAGPTEAHTEIHELPPADMSYTKKILFGYSNESVELVGMSNVISDLLAPGVWHIGYFMVGTTSFGSGLSRNLYAHLEQWIVEQGAHWMRLGVLQCNPRAGRFWRSLGYTEVSQRHGVQYGKKTHTLDVLYKPLTGGTVEEYRALVPRDVPQS